MPETPVKSVLPSDAAELQYEPRPAPRRPLRSRVRSWARNTFSRESLLSSVRSLAWVVPLTVLIWVYAEREQVATQSNFGFTVDVHSTDPSRIVTLRSPAGGIIHADLRGPQGGIDEVKKWLDSEPVALDVDRNFSPGEMHQINADVLNNQQHLKQAGVTISNCVPNELMVYVDALEEMDNVKVSATREDLNKLAAPPVFTPDRIKITGPHSVLKDARERARSRGQEFVAYADLSQFAEMNQEGKHTLSSVPVATSVKIDNTDVRLSPTTVSAQIEVRQVAEYKLDVVAIFAGYPELDPAAPAAKYQAKWPSTITNVEVVGPPDEIERLKQQAQGFRATFLIDDFTNPTEKHEATVYLVLPHLPGIKPKNGDLTITYTLELRPGFDQ
jgi:hypothetical protein